MLPTCAGWQRLAPPADTTLAPRQQVQVWRGSEARVLHAISLTPDSLFGVPFQQPPSCGACRVAIPRATVDSLRLGHQETAALFAGVLAVTVLVYLLLNPWSFS